MSTNNNSRGGIYVRPPHTDLSEGKVGIEPFRGCYNRSYYDKHGKFHPFYTTDGTTGKDTKFSKLVTLFSVCFILYIPVFSLFSELIPALVNKDSISLNPATVLMFLASLLFLIPVMRNRNRSSAMKKYFNEHPEALTMEVYRYCPSCKKCYFTDGMVCKDCGSNLR